MAKKGMRRPDPREFLNHDGQKSRHPKNDVPPVPELQGHAKRTKEKAKPITEQP